MNHISTREFSCTTYLLLLWVTVIVANRAIASDPNAVEAAKSAVRMKDYATAVKLFSTLAEEGDIDAQYQLGVFYLTGRGIPKDNIKAFSLFQQASKYNHVQAMYNLGIIYEK